MAVTMATYYIFSMIMKRENGVQADDSPLDSNGFRGAVVHWSVQ